MPLQATLLSVENLDVESAKAAGAVKDTWQARQEPQQQIKSVLASPACESFI